MAVIVAPLLAQEACIRVPPWHAVRQRVETFQQLAPRGAADDKALSPAARELLTIRRELGLTQADFAIALGVPAARIINIENRRAKRVPAALLAEARRQREAGEHERARRLKRLRAMPIPELLARWWSMLGVERDEDAALRLGITARTIQRWRTTGRLPQEALLRYEHTAEREAERRAAAQTA